MTHAGPPASVRYGERFALLFGLGWLARGALWLLGYDDGSPATGVRIAGYAYLALLAGVGAVWAVARTREARRDRDEGLRGMLAPWVMPLAVIAVIGLVYWAALATLD